MNAEQREEGEKTIVGEFSDVKHTKGILSMGRLEIFKIFLMIHILVCVDKAYSLYCRWWIIYKVVIKGPVMVINLKVLEMFTLKCIF